MKGKDIMATSNVILVNNTNCDIRMFSDAICEAVRNNTGLPEDIADLFDFKIIDAEDGKRGILNPA
jgi:hypothetical protein